MMVVKRKERAPKPAIKANQPKPEKTYRRAMKKFPRSGPKVGIFTLNIGQGYDKEVTDITYPLIKQWAYKIGADFYEITERKFLEWPVTYEKLQIYQLGQEMKNEWNIFIDCDAIIHPDLMDITQHIPRDTVAHNGSDIATMRWRYDRFFKRDGRIIGSATWFCVASDWCIELFKPLDDLTPEEVSKNIFPLTSELKTDMPPIRLVDDYVMSRNIAKFGLKFMTLNDIYEKYKIPMGYFVFHMYACPQEQKVEEMRKILKQWGML